MNFRVIVPGLVLMAVLLVSCAPVQIRDNRLLPDTSLLTDDPCAAPCFRGVIPGETAWTDALPMIQDDPAFANVQVASDDSGAIGAQWQAAGDGNPTCCQIISFDGERVDIISLALAPTMTVEEVIDAKGEPAYVLSQEVSEDQALLLLVYPEQQMVVYAFVAGAAAELLPTSEIVSVTYYAPNYMDLAIQSSNMDVWNGYQPFSVYADETFDVTASITATPVP